MRLSALAAPLALPGDLGLDPEVSGVQHDSRKVVPGDLFVAWTGQRHDGSRFAAEALARGAVAFVSDRPRPSEVGESAPWLVAAEPRALLGRLAAPLYGHPDRDLVLVGVTGTNGKSTVVELVAAMLDAAELPAARIGTLGYRFAGEDYGATERTTPEASDLFRLLATFLAAGARATAMEVSSHALAQGRIEGARFDVGVFLNLTRDHFDFHGDFASYFAAKADLFARLKPEGRAVVSADDEHGRRLLDLLPEALSFGTAGTVRAERIELSAEETRGTLATPRGRLEFVSPLLGRFNLENLVAATAVGEALALPQAAIVAGIAATRPLAGRMDPVIAGQAFPVLVDYAHTPAALEAALRSAKEFTGRKLVLVFGCGGDRDPGKRPQMGEIAGRLADLAVATSDNPRSEDPLAILAAVEEGLKRSGNSSYRVVPDRREAIRRAVGVAASGNWALVVAGKGHESHQQIGSERLPFSDRAELERALAERLNAAERG